MSSTSCSPSFSSGAFVTMYGTSIWSRSNRSTSSICILMPPEQTTLSLRPSIRNLPCPSSAMSLVTSVPSCTKGASMARQPSALSETCTPSKGVYHSLVSGPLSLRRAMCDRVSVIPYVLHIWPGRSCNIRAKASSMAPPPIMRWRTAFRRSRPSASCNRFQTCRGTIAAKSMFPSQRGVPQGSVVISFSPQVKALTTIILPAI